VEERVNYYERYCGDYAKKTARLTLIQHGAYTLLLDEYYSTEQPLSADFDELFRICRAMKKAEQDAVCEVAEKFFPIAEDGLRHNDRADEMIARARPKMEAARANGKKGGRPKKNPLGYESGNPAETQSVSSGFPEQNPAETQIETTRARSPAPAPTPLPTNNLSGSASGIGINTRDDAGALTPAEISVSLIGWERERHKAARGITASNQQVIDLAGLCLTAPELRAAYDSAVADRMATEDPNPVNAGFIAVFVNKIRNPPKPRPKADNWDRSPAGIERKASELGIYARAGESHATLAERCRALIQQQEHAA
jgi:uncharacterized protein YdaU (DUF1376 family)